MRVFVAVDIPKDKIKPLVEAQSSLKFGRFKMVKDFHITLQFLGDLSEDKVRDVEKRLSQIRFKRFFLTFAELGVFPSRKFIRVIWAGTHGEAIYELKHLVNDALSDYPNKTEGTFVSHITLARVLSAEHDKLLNLLNNIRIPDDEFEITSFKLKSSTLTPEGPIYKDLKVFNLF